LATGYLITVNSGPNILTVTDATAPGLLSNTTLLTVSFDGHTGTFAPGGTFDFGAVEPGGVTQFTLTGISPLDVIANPSGEFVTSFTFAPSDGTQDGQITETALQAPEPGSLTLWGAGALCLLGWRQRRRK
jgi:MYXO-CTERM domain-containing protein